MKYPFRSWGHRFDASTTWALFILSSAFYARQLLAVVETVVSRSTIALLLWVPLLLVGAMLWRSFHRITFRALALLLAGVLIASRLEIVEERVHLLEYGLLGYLLARKGGVMRAAATSSLVGIFDELIQACLPYRVGDPRDVFFDTIGGALGVALRRSSKR